MQEPLPDIEAALALVAEYRALPPKPTRTSYEYSEGQLFEVRVVPIEQVLCFKRKAGVPGLVRERALSVLQALRDNVPLPPVNVYPAQVSSEKYQYLLYHGYHRLHISVAAGYTHIPVAINYANRASAA